MEKRTCLECGEEFSGRIDKKFCSDMCRNAYNNKLNSDNTNLVRNINNILRKNRRILQSLNKAEKTKVHRKKLVEKGFDFNHFTNIYRTQKGSQYYFCYEQGYLPLDNDFYFLVINKRVNEE
ncbi:MAG: hypothetical protein PHR81_00345 [Bacteroidales bacterium]|jgi:hypothetical protein|nr:hypothetical protein [Bacteroidales bacterium]MDD4213236.1 hypothetical protein [Bacteroidales bacterium]